jgi:hypothetical protein
LGDFVGAELKQVGVEVLGLFGDSIRSFGELISYVWNQKTIVASQ